MLDLSTIIGMVIGLIVVVVGIFLAVATPGDFMIYVSISSLLIVVGGAFSATLINFPASDLKEVTKVIIHVFRFENASPLALIEKLRTYAEIARRDGILALESVSEEGDDEFLVKGIQLAVDGTDPEVIKDLMDTELDHIRDRHEKGRRIFENLAKYSPAFGMIGTLIGLVSMLANLEDPSQIGMGMAVALLTTLYGAIMANLFFDPIAEKLGIRSQDEMLIKEMIIRGVISIQSGDNPRVVEQKLRIFLAPAYLSQLSQGA